MVHVSNSRGKFQHFPTSAEYIKTTKKMGYKFELDKPKS